VEAFLSFFKLKKASKKDKASRFLEKKLRKKDKASSFFMKSF
jgi:hypothetical protein